MLHVGLELPFDVLEEVLASTAMELERNQIKIANPGPKDDVEVIAVIFFYFYFYFICLLFFIWVVDSSLFDNYIHFVNRKKWTAMSQQPFI